MMYCTVDDIISRFGERELLDLTDRARTGQIDETMIARAISDAAVEIDSYLEGRYDLPLSDIPAVLVPVCADMARYYLYEDRAPEHIKSRYDDRVAYLVRVSKRTASLPISDTTSSGVDGETTSDDDSVQITSDGHDWRRGNGFGA